jgi:hypothetical protein
MQVVLTVNAVITRNYALTILHHNSTVITRNWARHCYTVITLHHYGRNYAVGKSSPLRLRVITAVITLSVITRNHYAHTLPQGAGSAVSRAISFLFLNSDANLHRLTQIFPHCCAHGAQ